METLRGHLQGDRVIGGATCLTVRLRHVARDGAPS
ncbi:hypothetical protein [Mesorhizobium qingshengii]